MLESRRAAEAADLIWRHWQAGTVMAALPDELRPESRAEGYAVQAGLERFSDKPLFGWKIAATSVAGQRHLGVDGPLAGRILAEPVHAPGAAIGIGHNRMREIGSAHVRNHVTNAHLVCRPLHEKKKTFLPTSPTHHVY